ncbi:ATP-binding protein [Brucella thiophenivorans]|uniref:histidine kinase n=1 Tax=Brucella thiophenivorans TaxID=571255 RepID=A0A256FYM5_9HYPH|nr:HAMP domain-containing sensor histidine kinase [Brucella thiophenivorans]OYR19531.1 his Kinase A domain protein [Brucella thiophenivorans]
MNAILLNAAQILGTKVQALARFHERFCQRWTEQSDAVALRTVGSLMLMPALLFAAVLASGVTSDFAAISILAASFAGFAMILCALSLMGLSGAVLGTLNFVTYGAGLAAISIFANTSNVALWIMAGALPLEVWFISRKPMPVLAAIVLSASILSVLALKGGISVALASLIVMILYITSLIARSFAIKASVESKPLAQPKPLVADGDLQLSMDIEGVITQIAPQSAKVLGVEPENLEGVALIDRVHVADRVQYLSLLADLRLGRTPRPADIRLRMLENGTPVFLVFRMEGVAANGIITLFGRSIEGEHKLIEEINALKAQLEAERIGKGRLLATVSHELRTPLNSIIGFSDMLSHEMGCQLQNEKQREYAGLIHKSGHYLLDLVNSVLDNSKLETGTYSIEPQNINFREVAELCAAVMLPQAEKKGLAFCHRVNVSTGELVADRRAVQQILINLAANAVKFTQTGGCVTIDAARVMVDGRPHLEIVVSDTGIGIEPEDMQRIGSPFVRADNHYTRTQEGSGLGLSVVKGLVELHQGSMQIKSCVGEGTVVTVHLPVAGPQKLLELASLGEEDQQQLGTVIDMNRHQGEWNNDWQKDENREQSPERIDAQARKTA